MSIRWSNKRRTPRPQSALPRCCHRVAEQAKQPPLVVDDEHSLARPAAASSPVRGRCDRLRPGPGSLDYIKRQPSTSRSWTCYMSQGDEALTHDPCRLGHKNPGTIVIMMTGNPARVRESRRCARCLGLPDEPFSEAAPANHNSGTSGPHPCWSPGRQAIKEDPSEVRNDGGR